MKTVKCHVRFGNWLCRYETYSLTLLQTENQMYGHSEVQVLIEHILDSRMNIPFLATFLSVKRKYV